MKMVADSKTDMAIQGSNAETSGFQNRIFRAEVGRTPAGSVRIHVRATNSRGRFDNQRQLAAITYELAAELERWSDEPGATWAVSPTASNALVDVELGEHDDAEAAMELVGNVLAYLGLA